MAHALILVGHADPGSFNHRLADAYARGFTAAGHRTERIDLAALRFDPILRTGYRAEQPLEPDLVRAREAIERADHLVWVFPMYGASAPAVVRGFVDRVFLPGWAFRYEGHALPTGLLRGRSSRAVVTMDSPWWWYSLALHRPIHRSFGSATLSFCGLAPVSITTVHNVRAMKEPARDGWCARVEALAADDARRAGSAISTTRR